MRSLSFAVFSKTHHTILLAKEETFPPNLRVTSSGESLGDIFFFLAPQINDRAVKKIPPKPLRKFSTSLLLLPMGSTFFFLAGRKILGSQTSEVFDHKPGFGRMCERYSADEADG